MNSFNETHKPDRISKPPLLSVRLLDQLRERIRYLHYSLKTEKNYVYWTRFYIRWHGLRHPRTLGAKEIEAFLSMLANERKVSVSTHHQALSALLFLYREVLDMDLPWMQEIGRPRHPRRIPSVLTVEEVLSLLEVVPAPSRLAARLLYGTGMRLMEALRLRIKDVDFDRKVIIVRESKGNKDRVVMLPHAVEDDLRQQLYKSKALWEKDRLMERPGVELPHALETKYPNAGKTWGWQWVFPANDLSVDPRS